MEYLLQWIKLLELEIWEFRSHKILLTFKNLIKTLIFTRPDLDQVDWYYFELSNARQHLKGVSPLNLFYKPTLLVMVSVPQKIFENDRNLIPCADLVLNYHQNVPYTKGMATTNTMTITSQIYPKILQPLLQCSNLNKLVQFQSNDFHFITNFFPISIF